jgi:glycosyltransferase involved in cell wall biosynthesis
MINARIAEGRDERRLVQGVPVHEVTYRPYSVGKPLLQSFDPRVCGGVTAEVQRLQPDLVHIHNVSGATLAPFLACSRLGVPVVLTLHDHWLLCPNNMLYRADGSLCNPAEQPDNCNDCFRRQDFWANIPWRRRIFARFVRNVRIFISPSQKLVDLHVAAGYDSTRFRVVRNAIKPGLFQIPSDPFVRAVVREYGLFHTLLFAGSVVETKGMTTLIEAVPMLSGRVDRFRLVIAGTGDERFMSVWRKSNPSVVRVLGRVPFQEMRALYAAADLTVVPSLWYENSPMVVYESLLAGTPVLGSEIGGIPELIDPGKTGYLFPPGDPVGLTEQAARHFARPAHERRAMRRHCVDHAQAHMVLDNHLDRLQQVYDEALAM